MSSGAGQQAEGTGAEANDKAVAEISSNFDDLLELHNALDDRGKTADRSLVVLIGVVAFVIYLVYSYQGINSATIISASVIVLLSFLLWLLTNREIESAKVDLLFLEGTASPQTFEALKHGIRTGTLPKEKLGEFSKNIWRALGADFQATPPANVGFFYPSIIQVLRSIAIRLGPSAGTTTRLTGATLSRQTRTFLMWIARLSDDIFSSPDNAQQIAERTKPALADTGPMRVVIQALANVVLFIGIIGTFYGLIMAFGSGNLNQLLDALAEGESEKAQVQMEVVLGSFGTAFISSFFAYVFHNFARYYLELIEETREDLMSYLEEYCTSAFHQAIGPLTPRLQIDLPEATIEAIQTNTRETSRSLDHQAELADQIMAVTEALGQATGDLRTVVNSAGETADRLVKAASTAREHWSGALESWQETTGKFSKDAASMSSQTDDLVKGIDETIQKLTATTVTIQRHWDVSNTKLMKALEDNTREIANSVAAAQTAIKGQVEDMDRVKNLLEDVSNEVREGKGDLQRALETSQVQNRELAGRFENGMAHAAEAEEKTAGQLSAIAQLIENDLAVAASTRSDTLERLQRIEEQLAEILRAAGALPFGR